METKFTPGPWVTDALAIMCEADGRRQYVATCDPIARRSVPHSDALHEAKATAHLIAAAPTLYAVLEDINRRASPAPDRTLGDCADELMRIADIARAALTRARGESA